MIPAACFVLLLAPVSQAPVPGELQALFAEAVRQHQAGDLEGAVAAYRRFLERQPRNVEARSNLGAALARQGLLEEAVAQYREALVLDPARTGVRLNLGIGLLKSGRVPEAAAELERVVAEKPDLRNAVVLLAGCRAREGEFAKAAELLQPLFDRAPEDRAVTYLLGLALIESKQTRRGQLLLDRILRDGDSAEARILLGAMRYAVGEYAAARDDFARAAELNPALPTVHAHLGKALMSIGDTEAAANAFRRELESNPNDFDSNLYLGTLLRQDQKLAEAMERFRRAGGVRPGAPEVLYQIGSVHLAQGEVEPAREMLERVVAAAPDFVEAHVSLAIVYYRLKRTADGDRHREIVKELNRKRQAEEPGAKAPGDVYRGEPGPVPSGSREKPPS